MRRDNEAGPSTARLGSLRSGGSENRAGPSRRQQKPGKRDRDRSLAAAQDEADAARSSTPVPRKAKKTSRKRKESANPAAESSEGAVAVSKRVAKRKRARQRKQAKKEEEESKGSNEINGSFEDLDFEILGELGSGNEDGDGRSSEPRGSKRRKTNGALNGEPGPSTTSCGDAIPMASTSTPSAYRPLRRSVLAGMKLSPDPPSQPPSRPSSPSLPSTINSKDEGPRFNPPNLFSASLPITLEPTAAAVPVLKPPDPPIAPTETPGLLLPAHIILDGMDPTPGADSGVVEDEEGLFFLDEDTTKNVQRYFDPTTSESVDAEPTFLATADQSKICKKCKRPGHRAEKCPHLVCDICGAMDEHEKSQCRFGMKCFKCGERGHRREDCRNRPMSGCHLCGSRSHIEFSCPTHWRIYTYRTAEDRQIAMEEKENLSEWYREAAGGAGYEQWCYNCAREGHFGDDCDMRRGSVLPLETPSPFSYENSSRGPFSRGGSRPGAPGGPSGGSHTRFEEDLPDLQPEFAGLGAGSKGKQKAREENRRAERNARMDEDDDPVWVSGGDRLTGGGRGQRGGGVGTPMRFPLPPRPWDSERRERTPQSSGRGSMPFGHGHLMSAGPRARGSGSETHWSPRTNGSGNGPMGKGISFGRISMPGAGGQDTPTASRPGSGGPGSRLGGGGGGGAAALVARAMGSGFSGTPSRSTSSSRGGSPLANGQAGQGKKKRKSGDGRGGDEWADGRLGGNVAEWGREMDKAERDSGRSAKMQRRGDVPNAAREGGGGGVGVGGGLKIKGAGGGEGSSTAPRSLKSPKGSKGRGSVATAQKYYGGY